MLILLFFLLLTLFLYLIVYIFALTYFMRDIKLILLSLLCLIHYASDFYNINKARARASVSTNTSIQPYSKNEYIIEFII